MILRDKFDAAQNGRKCDRPTLKKVLGIAKVAWCSSAESAAATGRNMSPKRPG
jgi:hypothetical protein